MALYFDGDIYDDEAVEKEKLLQLLQYSDVKQVIKNAKHYLGSNVKVYVSTRANKKFMIMKPDGKWSHFGQIGFEDFTKHKNNDRRDAYLARATKIKGKWRDDPYSPNNMSIAILWEGMVK
jgi:hypothetical protein